MAAADQSISLMDGTYFVGRKEILDWINGICGTSLAKVEQTCTGAIACQILDSMYPGKVPMSKVDWGANKDYEYINNYKVLQKCFTNLKIDKHIEVDRLVRGKYQDNLLRVERQRTGVRCLGPARKRQRRQRVHEQIWRGRRFVAVAHARRIGCHQDQATVRDRHRTPRRRTAEFERSTCCSHDCSVQTSQDIDWKHATTRRSVVLF